MSKKWYIVHAYSNFEKRVAESIREQIAAQELDDLFEEILVPTEEVVEMRRGRKIKSERKFFPGYVLVKMDMTDQAYHLIKNTPKVTGFLGTESKPVPITDKEAEQILQQVQEGIERPKPSITFEVGEQVRVADGPFASFNGLVEEVDEERARVKVAVSIFGRATPVELEYGQVEKALEADLQGHDRWRFLLRQAMPEKGRTTTLNRGPERPGPHGRVEWQRRLLGT